MDKYVTISVPSKSKNDWNKQREKRMGQFLLEMCTEGQRVKGKKAFED